MFRFWTSASKTQKPATYNNRRCQLSVENLESRIVLSGTQALPFDPTVGEAAISVHENALEKLPSTKPVNPVLVVITHGGSQTEDGRHPFGGSDVEWATYGESERSENNTSGNETDEEYTTQKPLTWVTSLAYEVEETLFEKRPTIPLHVMIVDWATYGQNDRPAEQVANRIVEFTTESDLEWDLLLYGHSRGAIFNHKVLDHLGAQGNIDWTELILLDPTASNYQGDHYPQRAHWTADRVINYNDSHTLSDSSQVLEHFMPEDWLAEQPKRDVVEAAVGGALSFAPQPTGILHAVKRSAITDGLDIEDAENRRIHDEMTRDMERYNGHRWVDTANPYHPIDSHSQISAWYEQSRFLEDDIAAFLASKDRDDLEIKPILSRNTREVLRVDYQEISWEKAGEVAARATAEYLVGMGLGVLGGEILKLNSTSPMQVIRGIHELLNVDGVASLLPQLSPQDVSGLVGKMNDADIKGVFPKIEPKNLKAVLAGVNVSQTVGIISNLGSQHLKNVIRNLDTNQLAPVVNRVTGGVLKKSLRAMTAGQLTKALPNLNSRSLASAATYVHVKHLASTLKSANSKVFHSVIRKLSAGRGAAILKQWRGNNGLLKKAMKSFHYRQARAVLERVDSATMERAIRYAKNVNVAAYFLNKWSEKSRYHSLVKRAMGAFSFKQASAVLEKVGNSTLSFAAKYARDVHLKHMLNRWRTHKRLLTTTINSLPSKRLSQILKRTSVKTLRAAMGRMAVGKAYRVVTRWSNNKDLLRNATKGMSEKKLASTLSRVGKPVLRRMLGLISDKRVGSVLNRVSSRVRDRIMETIGESRLKQVAKYTNGSVNSAINVSSKAL